MLDGADAAEVDVVRLVDYELKILDLVRRGACSKPNWESLRALQALEIVVVVMMVEVKMTKQSTSPLST
jgi:hypothetical protein